MKLIRDGNAARITVHMFLSLDLPASGNPIYMGMWRSALLALAIILVTMAPSFGHVMHGSESGLAKHTAVSDHVVAALPGAIQSDGTLAACNHMITPHCLGAIDLTEHQPYLAMEYSGRWLFHVQDLRLSGTLPAEDTPPPRT